MNLSLDRPVVILGAPRCGTSILGRLLQAHPDFVHAREPRLVWRYGNDGYSDQLLAHQATPRIISHIKHYFAKLILKESGTRLLEKTPSNSLRVQFVDRVFPDAIYVHITRNGFDAVPSIHSFWLNNSSGIINSRIGDGRSILLQRLNEMSVRQAPYYTKEFIHRALFKGAGKSSRLWGPRLPGLAEMVRDMSILEVSAMQWRQCTELACHDGRLIGQERYMEIRLEELNLSKLEAILEHAGLTMHSAVEEAYNKEFDNQASQKRRNELSDADRTSLRRIISPTMKWLGYDEPAQEIK